MTTYQILAPNAEAWDAFVAAHPDGHILQTPVWGQLKAAFGWRCTRVGLADKGGRLIAGAQILLRPLPFRLGALAYVARGPLADWDEGEQVSAVWEALHRQARRGRAALLKVELHGEESPAWAERLRSAGLRPSAQNVQPPRTLLVDLTPDEGAILAAMKQKTRYNIRLSEKRGVRVREGSAADLEAFNALMHETGQRDAFGVHAPEYYRATYELFTPLGRCALLMASLDGQDLAGVMVFALGRRAWYFYGASSDTGREHMPTYAAQWAAMRWAKARGCAVYDLYGVPDAGLADLETQFESRSDGLWGVYRFKRGWGGRLARLVPAWDYVYNPLVYSAYSLAARRMFSHG